MTSISLEEFEILHEEGVQIIDSRPTSVFASSYIPNSVNASLNGSYEYMASCIFNKGEKIVIICDQVTEGESVLRLESEGFKNIFTFFFDYWKGKKTMSIERYDAKEAHLHLDSMKDVSNAEDWEVLHVKGVENLPLVELVKNCRIIEPNSVLYCGNGHKSMAAVSFLMARGIVSKDIIGGLSAMLVDAPTLEI